MFWKLISNSLNDFQHWNIVTCEIFFQIFRESYFFIFIVTENVPKIMHSYYCK